MRQWKVGDVMTPEVVSVPPHASYRDVVDALMNSGVSAAPVVDSDGRVVGVVSEADLLHKVEAAGDDTGRGLLDRIAHRAGEAKAHSAIAADLMTAPAVVTNPETSVAAVARRLEAGQIKRMPVVDADGRLVGIVSRRDLLRIHTRSDESIRDEVVDDVVRRVLWIDPSTVRVEVVDGVVTVEGKLESRSLAGLLVDLVADVAGVVDVVDRLSWDQDDSRVVRSPGYAFGDAERLFRPSGDKKQHRLLHDLEAAARTVNAAATRGLTSHQVTAVMDLLAHAIANLDADDPAVAGR